MEIRELANEEELAACAQAMSESEPWRSAGRNTEACLASLHDPASELYVAVEDNRLVGFLSLTMKAGIFRGYIRLLFAWPDRRSVGVGARLLAFGEERIFRDAKNVFLCVSAHNPRAKSFYERHGYQVVGELTDFLAAGKSEILMRKTMGPTL